MSQRALVITLNLDSEIDDAALAEDVLNLLEDEGYSVISVNPFGGAAPTAAPLDSSFTSDTLGSI